MRRPLIGAGPSPAAPMERATECKNLMFHTSHVPASTGDQHVQSAETPTTTQTPTGNVLAGATILAVQRTAEGCQWTAGGNVPVLSDGKCPIAAVSPSGGLSSSSAAAAAADVAAYNERGPAELLLLQAERCGSTAPAQTEEQGLGFSSVDGGVDSGGKDCLPHPSNTISVAAALGSSTVSPRDFLSSSPPPVGGPVGLPLLWSGDTPTAAAGTNGRDRGPTFCRPIQSPSLCGAISAQQLGGIPLLPTGGCELTSPSIEGSQQRSNGVSPHAENISKKFFFSAPFTTPRDPSGGAATGFFGGFAAAVSAAAQSRSAAESPTGAELATNVMMTRGSNVVCPGSEAAATTAAAKSYEEECQSGCLMPSVSPNEGAAAGQDSLVLHLQSRALHATTSTSATAADAPGPPPREAGRGTAITSFSPAGGAGETAAAAGVFNATAARGGRMHRGVRPAAKSAILRCSKRGSNTGAAAVVTAAAARNSLSKATALKRNNVAAVRGRAAAPAGKAAAAVVPDVEQQSLLSGQEPSAAATSASHNLRLAGVTRTFAAGRAQSNTSAVVAAAAIAANEAQVKAAAGFHPVAATAAKVSFSLNTTTAGHGAAAAEEEEESSGAAAAAAAAGGAPVVPPIESEEIGAAAGDLNTTCTGSAVFLSELYEQQKQEDKEKALLLMKKAAESRDKKKNTGRIGNRTGAAAAAACRRGARRVTSNKLYTRDSNRTCPPAAATSSSHRLQPRASTHKPCIVERVASPSPRHPLLQTCRPSPHARRGYTSDLLRTHGGGLCSRNNSINRRRHRRCQLKGKKKTFGQGGGGCSLQEAMSTTCSSSSKLGRKRRCLSAGGMLAASAASERNRSNDTSAASMEMCAAPLASAFCGIEDDVIGISAVEAGEDALKRIESASGSAAAGASERQQQHASDNIPTCVKTTSTTSTSGLLLQFDGSSSSNSRRHNSSRTGGGSGAAAGYPTSRLSQQQHSQQMFFPRRTNNTSVNNIHRTGTKGGAAAATAAAAAGSSCSCSSVVVGSLSERVRMIVEKAMMSKHKIVWIERSEAKGFLPLPGMQEEKVYLVWTEKGIDVLVDLQAYIPWTHCPILMPAKHRRLHIPLLILSSTSLSSLFAHVCRRTATSVFRLPLTRTPAAYRHSMLQMLRGEPFECRQQQDEQQQQAARHQAQQEQQQQQQQHGWDEYTTQEEAGERRKRSGRTMVNSRSSNEKSGFTDSGRSSSSFSAVGGIHREEETDDDRSSSSLSPCSTSAGSTGPSSLPSPPATAADASAVAAAETSTVAVAETTAVAVAETAAEAPPHADELSSVCAAGVGREKEVGGNAAQPTEEKQQHENSPEVPEQQQQKQEQEKSCVSAVDIASPGVTSAVKGAADQQAAAAAAGDGSLECSSTAANGISRAEDEKVDVVLLPVVCKEKNDSMKQVCSSSSSRGETDGGIEKESTASVTERSHQEESAAAAAADSSHSKLSRCASTESAGKSGSSSNSSVKQEECIGKSYKCNSSSSHTPGMTAATTGKNKKKVSLDMRDFYCCSQGKVVGEDYVYFRQMLPDDEGAGVYDISVSVKKRPKKTSFRKPRLAALWSMLAKREQHLVGDGISDVVGGTTEQTEAHRVNEEESTAAALGDPRAAAQSVVENGPPAAGPEAPAMAGPGTTAATAAATATAATAAAAAATGGQEEDAAGAAAGVALQFTREELLRVLAHPEETVRTRTTCEASTANDDANEDETKQAWKGSKWTYVEEYGDDGIDERLGVPFVFLSEMRVLLGLAASSTPHRCNMSLASHRVSGAVQRRVRMYLCDGENRGEEIEIYHPNEDGLRAAEARPLGYSLHAQQSRSDGDGGTGEKSAAAAATAAEGTAAAGTAAGAAPERQKRSRMDEHIKKMKVGHSTGSSNVREGESHTYQKEEEIVGNESREDAKISQENGSVDLGSSGTQQEQEQQQHTSQQECPEEARGIPGCKEVDIISHCEPECHENEEGALHENLTTDGTLVEIEFPTEFIQYRESDRIRLYGKTYLTRSLQILADVSGICSGADLSAVNLAQYAPNIFWNVVRFSSRREDLDEILKELCPAVSTLRRRRKRVDGGGGGENYTRARKMARDGGEGVDLLLQQEQMIRNGEYNSEGCPYMFSSAGAAYAKKCITRVASSALGSSYSSSSSTSSEDNTCTRRRSVTALSATPCNRSVKEATLNIAGDAAVTAAAGPLVRQLQREERRQKELELRFQEMKIEFDERAKRILARRDALKNDIFSESKWSKKSRLPAVPENDDGALINAVIDPVGGILKWPLSAMTVRQKNVIYQACLKRDLTACIRLTRVPGKGRAVFAADRILKDDFVVEYKGELCSEREAREREQRYNRSKVPMGSFMFYFKNGSRMMAIDATDEKQDFGPARLINHSRRNPNMTPRAILLSESHGEPRLIFVARRNIEKGEELLVDYGERDPDVIREHPWLNN